MQITATEARTWINWTMEIMARTDRLRVRADLEDATMAHSFAERLLDYMHVVFVVGADVEPLGTDVRQQSMQYFLRLRETQPEFEDVVGVLQ